MDKKQVIELAREKLTKLRYEFPELVRETGEGVCAKLSPIFYKAKAGILGRFIPEKKVGPPQKAVVIKDYEEVENETDGSRTKVKFTKGRIKRSGYYIFKNVEEANGVKVREYSLEMVSYDPADKDWWISDYPNARATMPFENDGTDEWARLE